MQNEEVEAIRTGVLTFTDRAKTHTISITNDERAKLGTILRVCLIKHCKTLLSNITNTWSFSPKWGSF